MTAPAEDRSPERGAAAALSSPPWPDRWLAIVQALMPAYEEGQVVCWIERLAGAPTPQVLAFVNAHALNLVARDDAFFNDLRAADYLARDGQGMAWLMRLLGLDPGLNLNGTDLIPRLLLPAAAGPVALLGTREPWLSAAARAVQAACGGPVCITLDGFQPAMAYRRLVERHRPRLVVLGMGMPRQERIAQVLRTSASAPCLIVCGGAILDFLGGRVRRAPASLRRVGLEWLWRLACEPRRLFARYVIGNPVFLARALRCAGSSRLARA